MERREFMQKGASASVLGLMLASGWMPAVAQAQAAGWNKAAFDAKTLAELAKTLGTSAPVESKEVDLQAPEIAENGNTVPVSVEAPGATEILLLASGNPTPGVATFKFGPLAGSQKASTRMRLAKTQDVVAVAKLADGKVVKTASEVKVTIGGCGG